ncbi:cell division protein FtsL [Rhizobium leguminosarum]|uniref:cell division protein FtsL n=1 Tax=Rhizobium leguminosarum TaxID=384 RepID=UPI003ECCF555
MLKTFDLVLIGVMTATAAVTYTIKHRAELKLEEVHRLEAEIKLEKDTIDLLKADWALQSQPNRLERLVRAYNDELKLQPTESTALVHAKELPMLKSEVPVPDVTEAKVSAKGATEASAKSATEASAKSATGASAKRAPDTAKGAQATAKAQPIPMPAPRGEAEDADQIETGSVEE